MKPSLCIDRKCFGPANDANTSISGVILSHMTSLCICMYMYMYLLTKRVPMHFWCQLVRKKTSHATIHVSIRFHLTKWLFLVSGYWYVVVPSDPGLSTSMTSINDARQAFMNVINGSVLPQDDMVSLLLYRLYNYNIHFCTPNQAVLYVYQHSKL